MKKILLIAFCISLLATNAISQKEAKAKKMLAEKKIATELYFTSRNVAIKDQPYSVEAVSESVQTLADGNRITKSSTVRMYRDSEGRTRREPVNNGNRKSSYAFGELGITSIYGFRKNITIFDPVASVRYTLNPKKKTAYEYKIRTRSSEPVTLYDGKTLKGKLKYIEKDQSVILNGKKYEIAAIEGELSERRKTFKSESLGTKIIEGVEAEGTKTTRTIEAGKIGNELPIEITYEKWYSKELGLIVYSRRFDPRYGEQIYRLVNLDRSEPDISLFMVPSDYEIVEKKSSTFKLLERFKEKQKKEKID